MDAHHVIGERRRPRSVSSSDEDAHDATHADAQSGLARLMEDYPAPLTLRQRRLFFRHVAFHVRRYQTIQRASRTVLQGWDSLHHVMGELQSEKTAIERALQEMDEGGVASGAPSTPASEATAAAEGADAAPSAPAPAPTRPRRILAGGRGGGVFAHLQSVLQSAKKEEVHKYGDVRQARERIAKQTRLQIVQEDLALHNQYYAPLEERRLKCEALESECREMFVLPLLALQHTLYEQEGRYAAAFSLRTTGPAVMGSMFGVDDDDDYDSDNTDAKTTTAKATVLCDVYCALATYTDDVLDVIRTQVEDVLDDYLSYRARMDPVLSRLEQEQAAQEAQRADRLMNVMGLPQSGDGVLGNADDVGVLSMVAGGSAAHGVLGSAPLLGMPSGRPVRAGLDISDDDDDEALDLMDVALDFDADSAGGVLDGAEAKKKERAQIQSALSVLDDFESMF